MPKLWDTLKPEDKEKLSNLGKEIRDKEAVLFKPVEAPQEIVDEREPGSGA